MSNVDVTPANCYGYNTLYHSHPTISDDSGTASSGDIGVGHNLKEEYDYKYFGIYYTNSNGENEYEYYKP